MKFHTLMAVTMLLAGCISPKSFLDPNYPKVSYEELQKRSSALKLTLTTQFQRNGEPQPRVDTMLKDNTERILRASSLVVPVTEGAEGEIRFVVNNIADMAAASAKGIATGLTFGLAGTTVTDAYEMSVTITVGARTFIRRAVKHAIHTAVGNTSVPHGVETIPPHVAFERVLEQMILRVLKEYQMGADGAAAT